jgi:hypothetical protein
MGSGSPVSQGATIPQSATTGPLPVSGSDGTAATTFDAFNPPAPSAPAPSAPVFDAFNPPSSKGSGRSPFLLGAGNSPSFPSSGIPGDPFDQPLPPPGPDRPPGRIEIEDVSFQERLARSRAGTGPLFLRVRFVPFGPGEHEEFLRGLGFSGATLARKLGRSGSGSSSGSSSGSGSGSSSRITIPTGSSSGSSSSSSGSDATFDAFTPPPPDPVFDAFTPPPPSPRGQDELDARPPGNQQPIISPAPRRLAPSGEGFSLPSPFEGTAETVGGIASIADTALGLGLGPAAGIGANLLTQAGQFANIPERQRGSIDAGEAVSSLLPFGLGGDNVETQFAKLTSQDELNAGESIPNIPTGQDELDAGITDDFSDFQNFQGFEGRSDGLIGFGFEDFEGGLPFDPDTAAPGSREEAFLQTINPDFKATGSGAQPLQRINEAAVLPESQIPFFDAFNPPAPDPAFFADLGLPGDPFDAFNPDLGLPDDAFNPDLAGAVPIIPGDPFFDAFNPPSNVGGFRPIGPQLQNPVFDAFDPPAPDTTFDAFDPPAPDTTFDAFDPPTPALSRNPEEAERQVKAANITQAVEAQNPGSLGRERVRSASQVLRENFDRKRGDTTFDAFNPSSLESGVQVAGLGDIVDFFTPENRLDQARRRAEESAARRRRGVPPAGLQRAQEAAALTNPVSGGVPAQGAVPNVTLGEELVPSSREVIRALAAPDGKGGIKPEADRGILDRILSNFRQGTPSATTQLPPQFDQEAANARFLAQQAELDRQDAERARLAAGQGGGASNTGQLEEGNQGTGRGVFLEFLKQLGIGGAAGGLVGLMRKGN